MDANFRKKLYAINLPFPERDQLNFPLSAQKRNISVQIQFRGCSLSTTREVLVEMVSCVSFHFITAHMLKTNLQLLLLILCLDMQAQNFSYTHYGIKEGLAGSNVYAATQDKEGFMWFATETGVSRSPSCSSATTRLSHSREVGPGRTSSTR